MIKRTLRKIWRTLFPTEQDLALRQWYADDGDMTLRQEYPLDEQSVVLDLGGYKGQWASDIYSRYRCHIFVFEPVKSFAGGISRRFAQNPQIVVNEFGLGGSSRTETINLNADGSSTIRAGHSKESIRIVSVDAWWKDNIASDISLMKINIEGGEFELLEKMIENDLIRCVKNIQVQFHDVFPGAKERMQNIREKLKATHRSTYSYEFIWENWELIS